MFKKIVKQIAEIETMVEFDEACGAIDAAFQKEKISWDDHETLYRVLRFIDREKLPVIRR